MIITIGILIPGGFDLYYLKNDKYIKATRAWTNIWIMVNFILILYLVQFSNDYLEQKLSKVLFKGELTFIFYKLCLLLIMVVSYFNFKMKEFFEAYINELPMKYEYMPIKNII